MSLRTLMGGGAVCASLILAAGPAALAQDADAAVSNPARAEANIARDEARRPAQLLEFLDVQPGDVVLDWISGGGYWSEILAGAVGPYGVVYAHNASDPFEEFENLEPLPMGRGEPIPLDDGSVDLVLMSYVYHHMHYNEATGEATPEATAAQLEEFHRVLAPGGRIAVIEHQAAEGTSREQSNEWHRIPAAALREDMTGAGFAFQGEAPDIYSNPEDTELGYWREQGLSGATTSLVHVYVKE